MSLQAYQLSYARGDRQLFSDINFEILPGQALWLTGSNGSGKTSMLRLLCGLASPLAGEVRWQGQDIRGLREDYSAQLLYSGHNSGVKDDLCAWENIAIGSSIFGTPCSREQAYEALAQFGLARIAPLPARVLSQGQRKRVALARLFIRPLPQLLILDEPFTALDKVSVDLLGNILNQHLASDGIVIYTTHQDMALQARQLHLLNLSEVSC